MLVDASGADARGLSSAEASERLRMHGPNSLRDAPQAPWWHRVARQLRSSLIYILLFALAFDLGVWLKEGRNGWPFEAIAIGTILLFNTAMGVWQEYRSEDALTKLRALATPQVWVMRDGRLQHLDVTVLVPGDVTRTEAGDRIPADARVLDGRGLLLDESILTGESLPLRACPRATRSSPARSPFAGWGCSR